MYRHLCEGMGPGLCNIAYAALDRHAVGPAASRTALRFVTDSARDGVITTRDVSYAELGRLSRRFSSVLRSLGINKGDRVFTLMGRTPELYIAMLGALRNGSVVSPLFSAFGPEPIATRVNIGHADVLVTTRAIYQRKIAKIRDRLPSVRYIFVVDDGQAGGAPPGTLDFWQSVDAADENPPIEPTTADDPALLHFTSGTTGTPKGAIHVHGAVVMHYVTGLYALDLHPDDTYWCTADPGWVTGTSYGIISPLLHGVTSIVDEADFDAERWYRILQDQGVSVWYTAPTAIRMLIKAGPELPAQYHFPRLRFIASVGEPLNPEAVWWGKAGAGPTDSRQLVADRDGRHHDRQHARVRHQARLDGPPATRRGRVHRAPQRRRHHRGDRRTRRRGRARAQARLAVDVPRLSERRGAIPKLLRGRPIPDRRSREERCRRLLLVRRAQGRRDQVRGASDRSVRSGKRADRPPGGRRGGRHRHSPTQRSAKWSKPLSP